MMTIHWIVALLAFLSVDAVNIPGRTTRIVTEQGLHGRGPMS